MTALTKSCLRSAMTICLLAAAACDGDGDAPDDADDVAESPGGKLDDATDDHELRTISLPIDRLNQCGRTYDDLATGPVDDRKVVVLGVRVEQTAPLPECAVDERGSTRDASTCAALPECFFDDELGCVARLRADAPITFVFEVENRLDYALLDADSIYARGDDVLPAIVEDAEPGTGFTTFSGTGEDVAIVDFVLLGNRYVRSIEAYDPLFDFVAPSSGIANVSELDAPDHETHVEGEIVGPPHGTLDAGALEPILAGERGELRVTFTPNGTLPNWFQLHGALVFWGSGPDSEIAWPLHVTDEDRAEPQLLDVLCENKQASGRRRFPLHGGVSVHLYPRDHVAP